MKASVVVLLVLAVAVSFGGTAAAVVIDPSCPDGFYRNGSPATESSQGATNPIPACTSYATHVAPSSGVVIPKYATSLNSHLGERMAIGIGSLLLGAVLAALALGQGRRTKVEPTVSAASA